VGVSVRVCGRACVWACRRALCVRVRVRVRVAVCGLCVYGVGVVVCVTYRGR